MSALRYPDPPPASGGIELRPFRAGDVGMLRDLATDPYLPLIGTLPAHASAQEALDFIERQHQRLELGVGYSFCVADRAGSALGTAGLWVGELAEGRATVGYAVAPAARGRGIATHALRALTAFGWTIPDLLRIEAYVEPWNTASLRTVEAVGFVRDRLLRDHQQIGDRWVDMVRYVLPR